MLVFFIVFSHLVSQCHADTSRITAYVLDTSGSMVHHGFDEAKEALIDEIKRIKEDDIAYIIPFAENERDIMRVEYEDIKAPNASAVERYIRNLVADGQYTNFDEGIDAAKVELVEEPREGARTIILISDGISDPDPHHNAIRLEELSKRIPREMFSLYLIDLSNNSYPGFSARKVGGFSGFSQPGTDLIVFPLKDVGSLKELLSELNVQHSTVQGVGRAGIAENSIEQGWDFSILMPYAIPLIALILVAIAIPLIILLRRRVNKHKPVAFEGAEIDTENGEEADNRNDMLCLKVADIEKRFGTPVMINIGGGKRSDFVVKGAKRRELTIMVSDDERCFKQRKGLMKKEKGHIFGSRSFSLMNGTPVFVELESNKKVLHRYL